MYFPTHLKSKWQVTLRGYVLSKTKVHVPCSSATSDERRRYVYLKRRHPVRALHDIVGDVGRRRGALAVHGRQVGPVAHAYGPRRLLQHAVHVLLLQLVRPEHAQTRRQLAVM